MVVSVKKETRIILVALCLPVTACQECPECQEIHAEGCFWGICSHPDATSIYIPDIRKISRFCPLDVL